MTEQTKKYNRAELSELLLELLSNGGPTLVELIDREFPIAVNKPSGDRETCSEKGVNCKGTNRYCTECDPDLDYNSHSGQWLGFKSYDAD